MTSHNDCISLAAQDYKIQLLVDIVSFVRRTSKLLLIPPVSHFLKAPVADIVSIKLFVLHDLAEEDRKPGELRFIDINVLQEQVFG